MGDGDPQAGLGGERSSEVGIDSVPVGFGCSTPSDFRGNEGLVKGKGRCVVPAPAVPVTESLWVVRVGSVGDGVIEGVEDLDDVGFF